MTKADSVLLITRNLPPLVGGMERLIWHIVETLSGENSVHVIGPSGCGCHMPADVTADEVSISPMLRFMVGIAIRSLVVGLRIRPNLVVAGSGLTAPMALITARLCGASCAVYLHGLDIEVAHPVYRSLWRPFFRLFDRVLVNSSYTYNLAVKAGISSNKISVLNPGVALPDLSQRLARRSEFRSRLGLGSRPLMLCVGRINARKGLSVFVRHILPLIIDNISDAHLVIIGDEPTNALKHTPGEWSKIQEALDENGLSGAVHFLGQLDDDSLSSAYMAVDVMVFPVQEVPGDIEGFGMVAIEAAAHDLPTVAFAVGGVPDAINDGVSGILIPPGCNEAFAESVVHLLTGQSDSKFSPRTFAASFQWDLFGKRLRNLLRVPPIDPF